MKIASFIRKALVILFWIVLWGAAAYNIGKPLLLPSPIHVFQRILDLSITADFWIITGLSLARITVGIIIGTILGLVLAATTAYSRFLYDLFAPIQTITKVTPVASFILLVLIWVNRSFVPAVIACMMVLPVIWNNVYVGMQNIDKQLLEMADLYHISSTIKMKRIIIPSVMPYFLSAAQTSIGIGWKAGIAAEVLTVPVRSIGKMIADSKMYMETLDLFAWTIVVIVISLIIEKLLVASIKKFNVNNDAKAGEHGRI